MNNNCVIELSNLSRNFGNFVAVNRISLSVERGEIFGFLGANGAGKTTAIRMMCGLLIPTSGEGIVAGYDVYTQSEAIKRNIGYMSQKFSLYPDLTGTENLEFYGAAYGLKSSYVRMRIAELTEWLELEEFINRLTGTIPTGWRQRISLAVSTLHKPELLFLDEPTSGVDPVFRRKFWQLLYQLSDDGVTVFVTTHYMDEAEYCGRISIMHNGEIISIGKPYELIRQSGSSNLEEMFIDLITNQSMTHA